MNDPELQRVQDRLTAAVQALAAFEHVRDGRNRIAADLAIAYARVQQLTYELARERNDVIERSSGVKGLFYSLIGDPQLTIEQREAMEAEARLAEAIAARDHLHARVAALDARLAGGSVEALTREITAARAAKEEVLIRIHHPDGMALQDLAVRIEAVEIELIPLDDAVTAGEAAVAAVRSVIAILDRARDERLEQADARGAVGNAQAAITVFHRAVDALVTADEASLGALIDPDDREPFVDSWLHSLIGKGDRAVRIAAARASLVERLGRLEKQLSTVRARRDQLTPRRDRLIDERRRLVG